MTTQTAALKCFTISLLGLFTFQQLEKPQNKVPELEAFEHYQGIWDSEFTIDSSGGGNLDEKFPGTVEAHWAVGGRFLQQTGTYQLDSKSEPMVITTLMTFDTENHIYRFHFFDSTGEHSKHWKMGRRKKNNEINHGGA